MDLKIISVVILMPVKFDAVAGEAAGDEALHGLIGSLARGERSSGDSRPGHQQNPCQLADGNS
jgi:hypothetical protein